MSTAVAIVRSFRVAASFVLLAAAASAQFKPLAPPRQPIENPLTPEKALLGKILFWEEQLSSDDTMACGTCHQPRQGGADPRFRQTPGPDGVPYTGDDVYGSPGVINADQYGHYVPIGTSGLDVQVTGRIAPSYFLGAYFTTNFWDGRASSSFKDPQTGVALIASGGALESQLVNPPVGPVEMSDQGRSWNDVVKKLAKARPLALASGLPNEMRVAITAHPTYADLFTWVYGDPAITSARVAFAIASYERSLVPDQTPWDHHVAGMQGALDSNHEAGLNVFMGNGRCNICHVAPLFSDDKFHAIGVRPPHEDRGLQNTTGRHGDRGRFKTPSLRDVGLRRRWMHDGRFGDMNEVIEFYVRGGDYPDNQDILMAPLVLTPTEKFDLLVFLTDSLTDPRVAAEAPPFDRPTLHSETAANPSYYGASSAGSGGFVPQMIAVTPPLLGNPSFRVGVGDALGGSLAFLALAAHDAPPGTTFNGIPLDISITPFPILLSVPLSGYGAGAGYGTVVLKVPDSPAFDGQVWFAQWFVVDPGVTAGLAASGGTRFEFFAN